MIGNVEEELGTMNTVFIIFLEEFHFSFVFNMQRLYFSEYPIFVGVGI